MAVFGVRFNRKIGTYKWDEFNVYPITILVLISLNIIVDCQNLDFNKNGIGVFAVISAAKFKLLNDTSRVYTDCIYLWKEITPFH